VTEIDFAAIFTAIRQPNRGRYLDALLEACHEFDITHPRREAAFVAQVGHETGGLVWLEELGGESYWRRYEGRTDLGNTQKGDGARYHGRGLIQLTGRANYRTVGAQLGLPLEGQPDLAAEVEAGARIAGYFWKSRGCNELADADAFKAITRKINGGLTGLDDRLHRWDKVRLVFGLVPIREVG